MLKESLLLLLFIALVPKIICCAQDASVGQILKSQEVMEKEESLRKKIEEQEKIFIKKIIVEGITLLSKEQIEEITLPFQKHWLSKEDIRQIMALIEEAYKKKGFVISQDKISYSIKRGQLIIKAKE